MSKPKINIVDFYLDDSEKFQLVVNDVESLKTQYRTLLSKIDSLAVQIDCLSYKSAMTEGIVTDMESRLRSLNRR